MPYLPNEKRKGLIAAGHWIIDHVKLIEAWPRQDTLVTIVDQYDGNGGCAYNAVKNLALMDCGFPLWAAGLIGDDADGETIQQDIAALGVDTTSLYHTNDAPTSYTDVMTVKGDGRRTFFHNRGTNALMSEAHIDLERSGARIFFLGYLAMLDALDAPGPDGRPGHAGLLRKARDLGMTTVADLVSVTGDVLRRVVAPCLPEIDVLICNEIEAAHVLGVDLCAGSADIDIATVADLAAKLVAGGLGLGALVHYERGCVFANVSGELFEQSAVRIPRDRIVGAAGAGDACATGFLLGLHEGWPIEDSLELAVCNAAISTENATCSGAIQDWRTTLKAGRAMGFGA